MDRIEAMSIFITALDEGSLAAAARRLKRSPAAVSRAIAFLEARVGAQLLHRNTRSMGFSEAGERYAIACRRMLAELEEAEALVGGEQAAPRGYFRFPLRQSAERMCCGQSWTIFWMPIQWSLRASCCWTVP